MELSIHQTFLSDSCQILDVCSENWFLKGILWGEIFLLWLIVQTCMSKARDHGPWPFCPSKTKTTCTFGSTWNGGNFYLEVFLFCFTENHWIFWVGRDPRDPQVQIRSEWPKLNPQPWCYQRPTPTNGANLLPTWKYKRGGSCIRGLERQTLHHRTPLFPGKAAPYRVYGCWRGRVITLLLEMLSCSGALEDWHKLFSPNQRREKMFQGYLISNCFDTTFCHLFCTFLEISGKIPSINHSKIYSVLNHQNSGVFLTTASPWVWSCEVDTNWSFVNNKPHCTNTEIQSPHLANIHMDLLAHYMHCINMLPR